MKKMISLLLALVMALSLVACAEQQNDDSLNNDTLINNDTQSEVQDSDHPAPPSDSESGDNAEDAGDDVTTPSTDESNGNTEDKQPAEDPEDEHKHDYATKVTSATCTAEGYTTYTCSCGNSYTDNTTKKLGHSYSDKVVSPTTAAQGYTLHTCSRCGDSYKDSYTAKLESKPSTGSSNTGSSSTGSGTGGNSGNGNSGASGSGSSDENTTPTPSTPSKPTAPNTPTQPSIPSNPSTPSQPTTPSTPSKPTHQCSYTASITPATCTTEGYTTYTCSCGDSYTDDYTSLKRHDWEEVWEEVPVYETVELEICNKCEKNLTNMSLKDHLLVDGCNGGWHSEFGQVQVGTENQLVGYACGVCGTPK